MFFLEKIYQFILIFFSYLKSSLKSFIFFNFDQNFIQNFAPKSFQKFLKITKQKVFLFFVTFCAFF